MARSFTSERVRGIGPRVLRVPYVNGALLTDRQQFSDDALGGRAYYKGRLELEIPLGSGAKSLGIRPSIFMDVGSVFNVTSPNVTRLSSFPVDSAGVFQPQFRPILDSMGGQQCINATTGAVTSMPPGGCPAGTSPFGSSIAPFDEQFLGDTWKPRLSVGIGFNWRSPFGPFRIDIAKALLKEPGDDTKLFTFNVGTQF